MPIFSAIQLEKDKITQQKIPPPNKRRAESIPQTGYVYD